MGTQQSPPSLLKCPGHAQYVAHTLACVLNVMKHVPLKRPLSLKDSKSRASIGPHSSQYDRMSASLYSWGRPQIHT